MRPLDTVRSECSDFKAEECEIGQQVTMVVLSVFDINH